MFKRVIAFVNFQLLLLLMTSVQSSFGYGRAVKSGSVRVNHPKNLEYLNLARNSPSSPFFSVPQYRPFVDPLAWQRVSGVDDLFGQSTIQFPVYVRPDVVLDRLRLEGAGNLLNLVEDSRALLREWLGWVDHFTTVQDAQAFIRNSEQSFKSGKSIVAGIFNGVELVGVISIKGIDAVSSEFELGYWIGGQFQGKGIISDSVAQMLEIGFVRLDLKKAVILVDVKNIKSQNVARRLGFKSVGVVPNADELGANYYRFQLGLQEWLLIRPV